MQRPFNFSAGPATIDPEVLAQAAAEMLDWPDENGRRCGMGVMEMSHRGKEFQSIYKRAEADVRSVLEVPDGYHILFMQGGGLGQNAIVPMNLSGLRSASTGTTSADFVVTGSWSEKSQKEAQKYCQAHLAASAKEDGFTSIPDTRSWNLHDESSYVHLCTNETIHGVEYHALPDLKALGSQASLVIDCSSHIASCSIDWSRVGLAFAGAQKNLGPAGVTLVIARDDLLGHAQAVCPSAFNYRLVADNESMFNTPPTYGIYMVGLVFQWLKRQGGVAAMEQRALHRATMLYDTIDRSSLYYNTVHRSCRSRMNIPFFLRETSLNEAFLAGANARGLLQLKGHKSVGGMRASLYNAMPVAGVEALTSYLREFEKTHG